MTKLKELKENAKDFIELLRQKLSQQDFLKAWELFKQAGIMSIGDYFHDAIEEIYANEDKT